MINKKGAESGIYLCADKTSMPIVQDDNGGNLWAALGATSNGLVVVDAEGVMAFQAFYGSLPGDAPGIEAIVEGLLQQ